MGAVATNLSPGQGIGSPLTTQDENIPCDVNIQPITFTIKGKRDVILLLQPKADHNSTTIDQLTDSGFTKVKIYYKNTPQDPVNQTIEAYVSTPIIDTKLTHAAEIIQIDVYKVDASGKEVAK